MADSQPSDSVPESLLKAPTTNGLPRDAFAGTNICQVRSAFDRDVAIAIAREVGIPAGRAAIEMALIRQVI